MLSIIFSHNFEYQKSPSQSMSIFSSSFFRPYRYVCTHLFDDYPGLKAGVDNWTLHVSMMKKMWDSIVPVSWL